MKVRDSGTVRVLVYGTLKEDQTNYELLKRCGAKFMGYDSITDDLLVRDLGPFPGVFESKTTSVVKGELYSMQEEALAHLDFYEGHPHFFRRRKLWTDLQLKRAWVYFCVADDLDDPRANNEVLLGLWHGSAGEKLFWKEQASAQK